jgi:hypothetical protein
MRNLIPAILLSVAVSFAADVSGNWQLNVETSQGSGAPTVTLEQKGEQLTGTFHSQVFGDAKLTGTVKGNAIEFRFQGDAGGQTLQVAYKGTVESATSMKGTAVYEGFDDHATWTAKKQ